MSGRSSITAAGDRVVTPALLPAVSVIIATRNRAAAVLALLGDLARQTVPNIEVIIVDDSDDAALPAALAAWRAPAGLTVTCIREQTGSLPRARNRGVTAAHGEYVVFADDDLRVQADFIAGLAGDLQALGARYAGGCALLTDQADFTLPAIPGQWSKRFFALGHYGTGAFMANGLPGMPAEQGGRVDTEIVSGGCCIYRRDICLSYRFDERMSGYSVFEDVDFSYRVSRTWKMFYDARVVAYHRAEHRATWDRQAYARMYIRNYLYHFHKNVPKTPAAYGLLCWSIIGLFCRAAGNGVFSLIRGYAHGLRESAREIAPV